jgi:hypothetical protein
MMTQLRTSLPYDDTLSKMFESPPWTLEIFQSPSHVYANFVAYSVMEVLM